MKKNEIMMVDAANNVYNVAFSTPRRFFQVYGGNSVLICGGKYAGKYEKMPDGRIINAE